MKLFFRFGTHPNLSLAEIREFLKSQKIDFEQVYVDESVLIANVQVEPDFTGMINQLGGTVKVGKIIAETDSLKEIEDVRKGILSTINAFSGKKYFGLSLVNRQFASFKSKKELESFGLSIKKELLGPARFVTSKEPELSSVIVAKEKLLTNGGDFNLICTKTRIYLGVTEAVQDFKAYSYRDFGRPVYDSKSGMLPPKVAQMMINLAGASKDAIILDPFCGSGTVLQELALKGYKNLIGSDLSAKAVADSRTNLDWLAEKDNLDISNLKLFAADATRISDLLDVQIDAIITEPFLGPALRGHETKEQGIKVKKELENLYLDSFREFKKILSPGAVVVIIVPAFKVKEGIINLNIIEELKKMGFELRNDFANIEGTKFRYPLMYYREDQRVLREVMVFTKQN